MTGVEIVSKWMKEYESVNGTMPEPQEIESQLSMAIEKERLDNHSVLHNIIESFEALGKAIEYTVLENKGKISIINRYEELGKALGVENSL